MFFCYCISRAKNELGQNPEENFILTGHSNLPSPKTKLWWIFAYAVKFLIWRRSECATKQAVMTVAQWHWNQIIRGHNVPMNLKYVCQQYFTRTVLPRSIAPVLSPNSPIAKILVCPDFSHYKYPVILPNSATAIRHSFSDTKVVKPIQIPPLVPPTTTFWQLCIDL
jgi:hypothetical protein